MGKKHDREWVHAKTSGLLEMKDDERLAMVRLMMDCHTRPDRRTALALSYIYGARPNELIMLTKENFTIVGDELRLELPTMKGGNKRIIDLEIEATPFLKDVIVPYVSSIQSGPIFPRWHNPTNINYVFSQSFKKTGHELNPNTLRHFRMSWLAYLDASIIELKSWKGAKSQESVEPYLSFKPLTKFKKAIR